MPELGVLVMSEPELSVDQLAHALDAILASPMKKVSVAPLPPGRPAPAVGTVEAACPAHEDDGGAARIA